MIPSICCGRGKSAEDDCDLEWPVNCEDGAEHRLPHAELVGLISSAAATTAFAGWARSSSPLHLCWGVSGACGKPPFLFVLKTFLFDSCEFPDSGNLNGPQLAQSKAS
eukprot:CAMPEP_0172769304 /NCGR_PEP_ID=MMETSP1074-20121228/186395_1 /TAXON_ID=2916 /ORGANISM="Ceratium fusus, Strain PA161109" /LENGTH=107 /DNA_ID=CAMNT_0013604851 /DNA_START=287 /DNA_END=607 /DNA_ORIENTATION=-